MTTITLFLLIGVFCLFWLWLETTKARELARRYAGRACKELGVQLLDQTVALRRSRLIRGSRGSLTIERYFRFEFSESGNDRNSGEIRLRQGIATSLVLEGANMGRVVIDRPPAI
jgi:hypothetical protein